MAVVASDERVLASDIHGGQHRNGSDIQPFTYHSLQQNQQTLSITTLDVLDQNLSQRVHINQVQNMNTNNVPMNQEDRVNTGDLTIDLPRSITTGNAIYHQSSTNESLAVHTLMNLGDSQSSKGTELRLQNRLQHTQQANQATQNRQYSNMNKNLPLKKIKVDFSRFVQSESTLVVSSQCDNIIDNVSCTPQVSLARVDSNLVPHINPTQVLIVANNGSQQEQPQQQNTGYLSNEFNSQMQQQVNSSLRLNLNINPSDTDRIQAQVSNHYNEKTALNFSHDLTQPSVAHQVHQTQMNPHHLLHQDTTRLLCENGQFSGALPVGSSWRTSHESLSPMKHSDVIYQNGCSTSAGQAPSPWNHHDTSNQSSLADQANFYRQTRTSTIPNQFSNRNNMTSSEHQNAAFSYNAVHHQLAAGHMGYRSLGHQSHHQSLTNLNPHSSITNNHHYDSKSNSRSQTTTPSVNDPQSSIVPINSNQSSAFHSNTQSNQSVSQPSTSRSSTVNQKPQSFECNTCGKILPSRSLYQIHIKSHSQDQGK